MKQQILQQLKAQSNLDISSYPPDAALPEYRIPTSLAVILDTLLHKAAPRIDALPAAVLTDIIEQGVIAWVSRQPEHVQKSLGITLGQSTSPIPPVATPVKPLAPVRDSDDDDADDPDPASAQRAADAYMSGTLGYTNMTMHANFNGGRGQQGGQPARKKNPRQGGPGHHSGGPGNGHGHPAGHGGGSSGGQPSRHRRRRSGGGPRPH